MRLLVIALFSAGWIGAADPAALVAEAGGAVARDRNGQIVSLDLRASWVSDSGLADLAALPSLSRLDLSLTRITDHGLEQLKNVPGITDLNLRYAELITDAGLATVKRWKHLKRLNVRGTKVTDTTLQHLSGVVSLESLDIGYAQITDVGLDLLTSLPNLKELTIGGNKLTDVGLQPLRQLTGLTYLDLSGSQRTDSGLWSVSLSEPGLDAVATLRNLRRLRLNGTAVSARGLDRIKGLAKLEGLDLEGCKRVGDEAVPVLALFPALAVLDLTGTAFTEKGIAALRQAQPHCKILAGSSAGTQLKPEEPED
jgi:Leucine-rich repeat (LRR) protein